MKATHGQGAEMAVVDVDGCGEWLQRTAATDGCSGWLQWMALTEVALAGGALGA